MKDLKKMISSGEQVIGGAIMYGAGKELSLIHISEPTRPY